jgi:uncharacterized protein (TIGR04255 family)
LAARTLPDFKKPPVVEVAISVFFQPLPGMKTVRFGEFWNANRKDYPKFEDSPPLVDNLKEVMQMGDLMQIGSLRRVLMITGDDCYVMQLQQNAFIHNWRKMKEGDEYPHFDMALKLFKEKFATFQQFVKENALGDLSATRYEVTYVNHLYKEGSKYVSVFAKDISLLRIQPAQERKLLPEPGQVNADVWFDLPEDHGTLQVALKRAIRIVDKKEVLQVELTARGKARPDFSDMDSWLEVAHEWIVTGFAEITTKEAHQQWERTI